MPRLPLVACRNVNQGEEERSREEAAQLTLKQKRFVSEYLIDLNASAAARRVGYADRSARVTDQRLLQNPAIVEAIASESIGTGDLPQSLKSTPKRCWPRLRRWGSRT